MQQQPEQQRSPAQQPPPRGGATGSGSGRGARGVQQAGAGRLADLALENAPVKVLQLIGDPRSGVADDVTSSPFGSTTVDMVHYQPSNEVYWYKYEFAGDLLQQTHRDARLSEYSKNLLYLLRARDPTRWTIEALAHKFRIRQQRVMAILALKEMEAASMESGASLPGALSAFAVRVHLRDVLLDGQGLPVPSGSTAAQQALAQQQEAAAEAVNQLESQALIKQLQLRDGRRLQQLCSAAATTSSSGASLPPSQQEQQQQQGGDVDAAEVPHEVEVDAATLPVHVALPRARAVSQRLQKHLAGLLATHGYDLGATRAQVLAGLDAQVAALLVTLQQEVPPAAGAGDARPDAALGVGASPAGSVGVARAVLGAMQQLRSATAALFDALGAALLDPPPTASKPEGGGSAATTLAAGATASPPTWRSAVLEQERLVRAVASSLWALLPLGPGAATAAAPELEEAVAPLASRPALLLRALLLLAPAQRASFLDALPQLAAALSAAGADLPATRSRPADAPPWAAAQDWLGAAYVSPAQYQALEERLGAVRAAGLALEVACAALQPSGPVAAVAGGPPGPVQGHHEGATLGGVLGVLPKLRRLRTQYKATVQAVQQQLGRELADSWPSAAQVLRWMHEADPAALSRVTLVEAARQLEAAGDRATAAQLRARLRSAPGHPALAKDIYPGTAAEEAAKATEPAEGAGLVMDRVGDSALGAQASAAGNWDVVAAWMDSHPGGKRYNRGSGERQVARVATLPAMEGQALSTLDEVEESQLSSINRQLAQRQQEVLTQRFKSDLLFNLGLRGLGLWDGSQPRAVPNLESRLDQVPLVVYDVAADGATCYPPLFVVEPHGVTRRPLNDDELAWQERRQRQLEADERAVHYTVTRIKRKTELL